MAPSILSLRTSRLLVMLKWTSSASRSLFRDKFKRLTSFEIKLRRISIWFVFSSLFKIPSPHLVSSDNGWDWDLRKNCNELGRNISKPTSKIYLVIWGRLWGRLQPDNRFSSFYFGRCLLEKISGISVFIPDHIEKGWLGTGEYDTQTGHVGHARVVQDKHDIYMEFETL